MSDRVLVEADIPLLVEALAEYSYMWEELALAFRLPRYVIAESGNGSSNITNIIQA